MAHHLVPFLEQAPQRLHYAEAFAGGAALLFKKPSQLHALESLNDLNSSLMTFWRVFKATPDVLIALIEERALYSQEFHRQAREIWVNGSPSELETAWSVFYLSKTSNNGQLDGTFHYAKNTHKVVPTRYFQNIVKNLAFICKRLQDVQLFNEDALHFIERVDSPNTFQYLDPPYVKTDQGHYKGYTQEKFDLLLDRLAVIKGGFLLSHYPNERLFEMAKKHGWKVEVMERQGFSAMLSQGGSKTKRREIIVHNIPSRLG